MVANTPNRSHWAAIALSAALALGCGPKKQDTLVASSATQAAYAERYPSELESTSSTFDQREEEVRAVLAEVPTYTDGLTDPDWKQVHEIIDTADNAGRSSAYAERIQEVRHVQAFFEAEKAEIGRKAGGAAQYAAKQGGCDAQVGGSVTSALNKAVEKQLEKRLRERNEAQQVLARYATSLEEHNASTLAIRVDRLSYASYVTWVELTETQRKLEKMIEDGEQVKVTADAFIAKEEAFQKGAKRTDAEKQASAARVEAMRASKSKADAAVAQAKQTVEKMKERLEKLQQDYNVIVGSLKGELEKKAGTS
jgi:hypothetical protein